MNKQILTDELERLQAECQEKVIASPFSYKPIYPTMFEGEIAKRMNPRPKKQRLPPGEHMEPMESTSEAQVIDREVYDAISAEGMTARDIWNKLGMTEGRARTTLSRLLKHGCVTRRAVVDPKTNRPIQLWSQTEKRPAEVKAGLTSRERVSAILSSDRWMTVSEVYELVGGDIPKGSISRALSVMKKYGQAKSRKRPRFRNSHKWMKL